MVLENVLPSLPGFPVGADCRPLFKPIDFVVFNGLSARGEVDSLTFVEVKTGKARLSAQQSQVRNLVECGKVRLVIAEHRGGHSL